MRTAPTAESSPPTPLAVILAAVLQRTRKTLVRAALASGCVLLLAVAFFFLTLPSADPLRTENPPSTAVMDARSREALDKHRLPRRVQYWVPLSRISPWLRRAVVNSEDARFYEHDGFDATEAEAALEKAAERGHLGRGASTITQQLAKNLWLGEERTLWRKLREYVLAQRLEDLGKRREARFVRQRPQVVRGGAHRGHGAEEGVVAVRQPPVRRNAHDPEGGIKCNCL